MQRLRGYCLGGFNVTQSSVQVLHLGLAGKLLNSSKVHFPHLKSEGHRTTLLDYCKDSVRHL